MRRNAVSGIIEAAWTPRYHDGVERTAVIRELTSPADPALAATRRLYEATIDRETRIPWEWMAGGGEPAERVARRRTGRDRWWPHLLVAGEPVAGFAYGSLLPGYGGYACHVGVTPAARGRGVARHLFADLFACFRRDAERLVEPLPFVIWESHRPEPADGPDARANWQARLRLFARVGGLWVAGVDFRVPNYMDRGAPPVRLELFLRPFDTPAERLDAAALRSVVAGLHRRVYTIEPGDDLYERAQESAREPRLRPATDARDGEYLAADRPS